MNWYCLVLRGTELGLGFYACINWKNGDLVGCYHSGTTNKQTNDEQIKLELVSQLTIEG